MSKSEQMENLKTGNGIQYLLDEGYRILGNPISVFDADYKLIAYTDVSADDYYWNEHISTGTYSITSQMFFMKECFTDIVANAEKLALMQSDQLNYDKILGHIYNGDGIKVANVMMLESKGALEQDKIAAFEILADLITNEIRDDEFYIAYGEAYQDAWIKILIDNDIEEKALYSPHVQILYNDFKTNLYLAVVDIAQSEAQNKGQKYFVDLFRRKRGDFKYAIYGGYIIIIMSTDYKTFNVKRELNGLMKYFEQQNMFIGISSCFSNLFELHKYYAEAVKALKSMKHNEKRHVFVYRAV